MTTPPEGLVSFGRRLVRAADKPALVQAHFDAVARRYDLNNTILSLGLHHAWKRATVRALGLRPGEAAVDVCGGTADLALLAARRVGPAGRVAVVDLNQAMMALGRAKVARLGLAGRVAFVLGDAERLPLAEASQDAALVGFGIRNLTRLDQGLAELHRLLRPGGRLAVLEFATPPGRLFGRLYDLYSATVMPLVSRLLAGERTAYDYLVESIRVFLKPAELAERLSRAGFERVTYRPLTQGIAYIHLGFKPRSGE